MLEFKKIINIQYRSEIWCEPHRFANMGVRVFSAVAWMDACRLNKHGHDYAEVLNESGEGENVKKCVYCTYGSIEIVNSLKVHKIQSWKETGRLI